ncbi:hypothetical protein AVEN_159952-1 [Araneus ventricosus]|uniref:ATP-dependent DNA helicase n=1 Tax=Araneus ventricosus TaxID=182803 RepID=A0A4Y2I2V5_ARAVE|nr:hypothetical protein AVEN_159952-1 [Araneus ventricosus]
MIHGPCGAVDMKSPCMKNKKCTKRFPRKMISETQTAEDGYPLDRRRKPEQGGHRTVINLRVNNKYHEVEIGNRWVVPYSPILSKMFQEHINVEYCSSVKSIKYICKYINKGSDMDIVEIYNAATGVNDEIAWCKIGPYIKNLKIVEEQVCETYREQLGLLEDDQHWDSTLQEPSVTRFSPQLRDSFDCFYLDICSHNCLSICGKTLLQLLLPFPTSQEHHTLDRDLLREANYYINILQYMVEANKPRLTEDHRTAYEAVINLIAEGNGGILFLDAPGGTGMNFLINLILAEIRCSSSSRLVGWISLAVASSGITSTILDGGRTTHSALQLPLNLAQTENLICNISNRSGKAAVLRTCKLIVWDECTISNKKAFEALDRTMGDTRNDNRIMGGVVILLSGDFCQTLPAIPKATPANELNACLKASEFWQYVQRKT